MDGSGKAGGDDTEVVLAAVLEEANDIRLNETQLIVASQLELGNDSQEGAELLVVSQQEVIRDTHEGTELVVASQQVTDYAQAELIALSQKEPNDKVQVGSLLVIASQHGDKGDSHGGAELLAALQKELKSDLRVGFEGLVTAQTERTGLTEEETDLVAICRRELNEIPEGGMQLVLASQQKPRDEDQEGTDLDETVQKEVNCDAQEGTQLVGTSQQGLINDTSEVTELVAAHRLEPKDNLHKKINRERSLQGELIENAQRGTDILAACEKDLNDDCKRATEEVVAAQKGDSDHNEVGAELVAASQNEPVNTNEQGTELSAASHKELNDDSQEEPELGASLQEVSNEPQEAIDQLVILRKELIDDNQAVTEFIAISEMEVVDEPQERPDPAAADHEAEEFEELCSTDTLAKATSRTTDVCPSTALKVTASKILIEHLEKGGTSTQVPVSEGRKIKWKDMARRKLNSLASQPEAIQPAVARKSEPRRRKSIPTDSAANIAIDAIHQQIPVPYSSPSVHNNFQSNLSMSRSHGSSPSMPANCQELAHTEVSPHSFYELLEATNSISVTGFDTPLEPLEAVQAAQTGKEFSIGAVTVDNADLSTGPPYRLASSLPAVSSGKPPRPPSSANSIKKCGRPRDFANPPIVQVNGQQAPSYGADHSHELNRPSSNHVHPQGLNLPHARRQPLPSANPQFSGPSSLSVPERDPPDDAELPSTRSKRKKRNAGQSSQQRGRNPHKRKLEQLRTQVLKKLKLWGRKSKLVQEDNGAGQCGHGGKRLTMGEEQRDVFVKKMVESCRKDTQMRETFLAAVKQLANIGVFNSAAGLLMDEDRSGRSKDVFSAWKQMRLESTKHSSVAVNLYKAVDELHKEREAAMMKLPNIDDTSLCSLSRTSEGLWELVFPDLGPPNRRTERKDEKLDEPLRPSKSKKS